MINTIESMKTPRWSTHQTFTPKTFSPHELSNILQENKGKFMWCECLSERHLPNNKLTRLYIDRDLKKQTQPTNDEIQNDYNLCKSKLLEAFGECEWAISQRHGFNKDKNTHCVSWHFVCQDLFIDYTQIPFLLEQKHIDDIFDTAIYKSSEQMWQLPWCHKTVNDTRVLTPVNYTKKLEKHFIQSISSANSSNTIVIKEEHQHKRTKYTHSQSTTFHSKHKNTDKLNRLLEKQAKDTTSTWYKAETQENGNETHYYKTQRVRCCFVTPGEKHTSNNFVLNVKGNKVYYKCMSKECIHIKARCLGEINENTSIPYFKETNEWVLDTNDFIRYRRIIDERLTKCLFMPKDIMQGELKKITTKSHSETTHILNKFIVSNETQGTRGDIILITYTNDGTISNESPTTFESILNHYADIKTELNIWYKHQHKRKNV